MSDSLPFVTSWESAAFARKFRGYWLDIDSLVGYNRASGLSVPSVRGGVVAAIPSPPPSVSSSFVRRRRRRRG